LGSVINLAGSKQGRRFSGPMASLLLDIEMF
jgi:hypothetical protein